MHADYESEQDRNADIYVSKGTVHGCNPHYHQKIELLYIVSGDVDVMINAEKNTLHSGEMAISESYDVHQYLTNHNAVQLVVIFPPAYTLGYRAFMDKRQLASHFVTDQNLTKQLYALLQQLKGENGNQLIDTGIANMVLGKLVSHVGTQPEAFDRDADLMRRILSYVEDHYADDITLESISANFSYNIHYFSRVFNRFFNKSLSDYLAEVRLVHVLQQLENSTASIADAAFGNGFSSLQSFYRHFSRVYHTSPKEYLAKNKNV